LSPTSYQSSKIHQGIARLWPVPGALSAESEEALLDQLRKVPIPDYHKHRRRLAQAEAPRQFFHRLHRDPGGTTQKLMLRYAKRQSELTDLASRNRSNHTM